MNRIVFIVSFVIFCMISYILILNNVNGTLWYILGLGTVLVSLRRHYLKLKPFWGGLLKDIPKYFQKDKVYNEEHS